ncbi:MAG: hypothetical protein PVF96_08295 [Candidatus Bathyarchaeota archaeon]|jgi:hypothetical protein
MVQMVRVNVFITNVSAERLWDLQKPIPPIKINTNLNLVEITKEKEGFLEVPFVLAINYNPSIAQISLKGKALVTGTREEIDQIYQGYKKKKPPPQIIVQSISNVAFVETVLITRTLRIPPPIPLPRIPPKTSSEEKPSKLDYTT